MQTEWYMNVSILMISLTDAIIANLSAQRLVICNNIEWYTKLKNLTSVKCVVVLLLKKAAWTFTKEHEDGQILTVLGMKLQCINVIIVSSNFQGNVHWISILKPMQLKTHTLAIFVGDFLSKKLLSLTTLRSTQTMNYIYDPLDCKVKTLTQISSKIRVSSNCWGDGDIACKKFLLPRQNQ